jgi:hypothetical protein
MTSPTLHSRLSAAEAVQGMCFDLGFVSIDR